MSIYSTSLFHAHRGLIITSVYNMLVYIICMCVCSAFTVATTYLIGVSNYINSYTLITEEVRQADVTTPNHARGILIITSSTDTLFIVEGSNVNSYTFAAFSG